MLEVLVTLSHALPPGRAPALSPVNLGLTKILQAKPRASHVLQESIKIKTNSPVARMIALLDLTLRPIKRRALHVFQDCTKIRTISLAARTIVALGRTLLLTKRLAPSVLQDSIKTKTISRVARTTAMQDRT